MTSVAATLLTALSARGWTVAVAESLTGGLVASSLIDIPGASANVRGGVVAYATEVKQLVLGVDAELLAERGAVDGDVAVQMAEGVRALLGADVGLATTGVAGPEPQDGKPVGTVWIGVATPAGATAHHVSLAGDRTAIRGKAVEHALAECLRRL